MSSQASIVELGKRMRYICDTVPPHHFDPHLKSSIDIFRNYSKKDFSTSFENLQNYDSTFQAHEWNTKLSLVEESSGWERKRLGRVKLFQELLLKLIDYKIGQDYDKKLSDLVKYEEKEKKVRDRKNLIKKMF